MGNIKTLFLGPVSGPPRPAPSVGGVTVLDDEGNPTSAMAFQYYPEGISRNKGANWSSKAYPGGSHPLRQWINGDDDILSMSLRWYCEDLLADLIGRKMAPSSLKEESLNSVNINMRLKYFEGLGLPRWDPVQKIMKCPPWVVLHLPGLMLDRQWDSDDLPCWIVEAPSEVRSCFPGGIPRLASQELSVVVRIQGPDVVAQDWGTYHTWDEYEAFTSEFHSPTSGSGSGLGFDSGGNANAIWSDHW